MIYAILLRRLVPFGLGFFTAMATVGIFGSTDVAELEKSVPGVQYSHGSSFCRGKKRHRVRGEQMPYVSGTRNIDVPAQPLGH